MTEADIEHIANEFIFTKGSIFLKLLRTEEEKNIFKQSIISELSKYKGTTWQNVFDKMCEFSLTWDHYSLSMTFLLILDDTLKFDNSKQIPSLEKYRKYLLDQVKCMPKDRHTLIQSRDFLVENFSFISKSEKQILTDYIHKSDKYSIQESLNQTKLLELQYDTKNYQEKMKMND
jgi:hypothetical protein